MRNQLLKEMSSVVSNGVKKGNITSHEEKTDIEVTIQETVTGQAIGHQDEETLEILKGVVSFCYRMTYSKWQLSL